MEALLEVNWFITKIDTPLGERTCLVAVKFPKTDDKVQSKCDDNCEESQSDNDDLLENEEFSVFDHSNDEDDCSSTASTVANNTQQYCNSASENLSIISRLPLPSFLGKEIRTRSGVARVAMVSFEKSGSLNDIPHPLTPLCDLLFHYNKH
jgi:hypothetical protein